MHTVGRLSKDGLYVRTGILKCMGRGDEALKRYQEILPWKCVTN